MPITHTVSDNITLGRGRLYFAPFLPGTQTPQAARLYLGNTPGCNLSGSVEKLDHYTADTRVRSKDRSITIEANYSGSLTTDNISLDNLAYFFLGEKSTVTAIAASPRCFACMASSSGCDAPLRNEKLLLHCSSA